MSRECTRCKKIKPLDSFYRSSKGKHGKSARCKECAGQVKIEWQAQNSDQVKEMHSSYWKNNKMKIMMQRYGITKEDFNSLLEKQDSKCAICGREDPGCGDSRRSRFSVDHDHLTGKIRGLLCILCNTALGSLQDSPDLLRKAATYIEEQRND